MSRLSQLFLDHVGQTSPVPIGIEVERAEGIYLYAPTGKRYIDLISGVSVSNVGHNNPKVVEAVCAQAKEYLHLMVYGEVIQSPQVLYAQKLAQMLPDGMDAIYFVNSGSEAVEAALKLAKRFTGRTRLVSFKNAYHGSTHGALSMMGDEYFRNSFRPLLPDTYSLAYNNFDALSFIDESVAAVIVEPIQGEAGFVLPQKGFLEALRKKTSEVGALLLFDEIQCGFGRTGKLFASQHFGVTPDILVMAKAFGGGMPLGGVAAPQHIMSAFKSNPVLGHITTFGGHPVCCAAGMAALDYIVDNALMESVDAKSKLFNELLGSNKHIVEIRSLGLLLAVEFGDRALCGRICRAAVEAGVLTEGFLFCESALRIAPPLIITENEVREVCSLLNKVIDEVCGQ